MSQTDRSRRKAPQGGWGIPEPKSAPREGLHLQDQPALASLLPSVWAGWHGLGTKQRSCCLPALLDNFQAPLEAQRRGYRHSGGRVVVGPG